MPIYTKTGDRGDTDLWGGRRVHKSDASIEAIGTVDELQAFLGLCRAIADDTNLDKRLDTVQEELYRINAAIAEANTSIYKPITGEETTTLEKEIDTMQTVLAKSNLASTDFLRPHGTCVVTSLHVARTICRRAERRLAHYLREDDTPELAAELQYLNRLSDWLFQTARFIATNSN